MLTYPTAFSLGIYENLSWLVRVNLYSGLFQVSAKQGRWLHAGLHVTGLVATGRIFYEAYSSPQIIAVTIC